MGLQRDGITNIYHSIYSEHMTLSTEEKGDEIHKDITEVITFCSQ